MHRLGAVQAAQALRSGELDLLEYVDALLERCTALERLNAFVTLDGDQVRERARSMSRRVAPLYGLPYVLKDNINTADLPTTACTPALRHWRPAEDAPVARALRDAGGLLLGKTTLHELALGVASDSPSFGTVGNPWRPDHMAAGSSSGTAVAVASGMAPVGLGTDTGGSCRMPAAVCGCAGFRPTTGRYDRRGIVPLSHTRDTPGPLARTVEDIELLDAVCRLPPAADAGAPSPVAQLQLEGLRIGVPRQHFYEDLHPGTALICEQALTWLRDAGAVLIEHDIPGVAALAEAVGFPVTRFETPRELAWYLHVHGVPISLGALIEAVDDPRIKAELDRQGVARGVSPERYRAALLEYRPRLQQAYQQYFAESGTNLMVIPTTPLPACPHELCRADRRFRVNGRETDLLAAYNRNTDPASSAGLPALTIPAGLADGLPVGVEFVGPAWSDLALLAAGRLFEAARPAPRPCAAMPEAGKAATLSDPCRDATARRLQDSPMC